MPQSDAPLTPETWDDPVFVMAAIAHCAVDTGVLPARTSVALEHELTLLGPETGALVTLPTGQHYRLRIHRVHDEADDDAAG